MRLRDSERKAKGVAWTSEQHSGDDRPRAWRRLGPYFADCDPNTISPEMLLTLRSDISDSVSDSEGHRVIKVWRALWKKMATFGYCHKDRDPSLLFANSAPAPRQAVWREARSCASPSTPGAKVTMGWRLALPWPGTASYPRSTSGR